MQSLLQTRPENLDDLTVQVALVRPGPDPGQGRASVHRSTGTRLRDDPAFEPPVEHESLREPLRDTLGVVVFQDQVLDVAMAAAGFSIGEAEGLRRAMSRKRSEEAIEAFRPRFVDGLPRQRHRRARRRTRSTTSSSASPGFGFPKSHAAAFALLAYQSAWLRRYYPAEFLCALHERAADGLLPAVVARARRAAARGRGAAAARRTAREAQCTIEEGAVRVGARLRARRSARTRREAIEAGQPYADVGDLARRASVKKDALEALVAAGACDEWGPRRAAALAARRDRARRGGRRRQPPARAAARADRRDPDAAGADAVGADARRLQAHVALGRRAPAASCCARICRRAS